MSGPDTGTFAGAPPAPVGRPQRVAARGWGSHRTIAARQVFQQMTERHARRIADQMSGAPTEVTAEQLSILLDEDLPERDATGR